ncbi:hypothetical protein [Sandarakinorhabdus sp.]|uniref:hypothetical protein n=1 Tax=Sandarakinorhabdus sp. TaxID=1916663 RepID=UPI00286DCAA4|nr:hypothetical protein [Sandarakinorhabdus sp.]
MTPAGKPLRALALIGAVSTGWLLGRMPALSSDYRQALSEIAAPPQVIPKSATPPSSVAPAGPPPALAVQAQAPPPAAPPPTPAPIYIVVNMPPMMAVPSFAPPVSAAYQGPAYQQLAATDEPPGVKPPLLAEAPMPTLPPPGYDQAVRAYAALSAGERRTAAALFDTALAQAPDNAGWQKERRALGRRWSGEAFSLLRQLGPVGPTASPVLGGGQSGGVLAYTINPLARRPLAIAARANIAGDAQGVLPETAQGALGVRWTLLPGVSISAERLFALGFAARNGWTMRAAAGGRTGRFSGYGEAGIIDNGDIYAGAQGRAELWQTRYFTLAAGAWGSVQTGDLLLGRFDIGPSLSTRLGPLRFEADWRFRVAGNTDPGSGPALTVSAGF